MKKLTRDYDQSLKQKKPNNSKYLLQVVICTYNRTEAAKRAVRSVLPYLELGVGLVVHSNSVTFQLLVEFAKSLFISLKHETAF